ncbi:MAG: hypothetical protein LC715_08920, partial [Gammaproteobacteria bacterium]|nr:hypothetical protein [Gammaproteobacteria bacterium]
PASARGPRNRVGEWCRTSCRHEKKARADSGLFNPAWQYATGSGTDQFQTDLDAFNAVGESIDPDRLFSNRTMKMGQFGFDTAHTRLQFTNVGLDLGHIAANQSQVFKHKVSPAALMSEVYRVQV